MYQHKHCDSESFNFGEKKKRNRFSTIKSWLLFKLAQHVASFSVDDTLGIEGEKKIKLSHIQCLQTK